MTDLSQTAWSEIDNSNAQFPPLGWPAGMFPNAVEPTARMMMGALKRSYNRENPVYPSTQSTADSYVVTPTQAPDGYGLYERWVIRMNVANASTSPTLTIGSLPPQPIRKLNASSVTVLAAGDIRAKNHAYYWDGVQFILEDAWLTPISQAVTSLTASTNAGLKFSGAFGAVSAAIDPTILPFKSALTSSDSLVMGDNAAAGVPKVGLLSALSDVVRPGAPQRTVTGNTTTIAADVNGHIYHPVGSTASTVIIDANANVAYAIGTMLTFVNEPLSGPVRITMATSDTLVSASDGSTGTRTLATPGMATAIKTTATRWMISGTGLS